MKILILYYSYGGNTRSIAKMLQKELGGDLAEIETNEHRLACAESEISAWAKGIEMK